MATNNQTPEKSIRKCNNRLPTVHPFLMPYMWDYDRVGDCFNHIWSEFIQVPRGKKRGGWQLTLWLGDHLSAAASSWVALAGHAAAGSGQRLFGAYTACISAMGGERAWMRINEKYTERAEYLRHTKTELWMVEATYNNNQATTMTEEASVY